jgi:hypothetical protein
MRRLFGFEGFFEGIRATQLTLAEIQPVHFKTRIAGTSLTFAFIKVQMVAHYHPFTAAVN